MVKVGRAEFVWAATEPGRFPPARLPEVAFAGRSNVGKSSAINRLLGRRGLARTSSTPGRTQQLNFFSVDDRIVFVDLPGYGYARVSQAARAAWRPLVESYLGSRATLAGVVLLVDVRRGLEDEEHDLLEFVASHDVPAVVVATKIDKLKRGERAQAERVLATGRVPVVPFSAVTGAGVDEVWRAIGTWTDMARDEREARRGSSRALPRRAHAPGHERSRR